MQPLFKSHYSVGKSILTLTPPGATKEGSSDSIFEIAQEEDLKTVILVEDAPIGFLEAKNNSESLGIQLIFGLRFEISSLSKSEKGDDSIHKIIIFSKDDEGCTLLNKIYSKINCEFNGIGNCKLLKDLWSEDHLKLAVPFYDSFLHRNSLTFGNCIPDFSFCSPTFFIEDNGLPFDNLLKSKVLKFCDENGFLNEEAKTIYYKSRKDVEAFQTYKCICNRSFGRKRSLSNPGLDHLGSREFCIESWKEYVNE
ncbi:MAG: hypothetical protein O3A15_00125 [Proteobacteria bacterium]|jgi:DNA polymerase III alpha subunit|nr:hypothetical protein [Pseudomonadota bacterium]